jgi:hypothetical protein
MAIFVETAFKLHFALVAAALACPAALEDRTIRIMVRTPHALYLLPAAAAICRRTVQQPGCRELLSPFTAHGTDAYDRGLRASSRHRVGFKFLLALRETLMKPTVF